MPSKPAREPGRAAGLNAPAAFDVRGTARTISAIENRAAGADRIVRDAYRAARHIPVVGITGPPGAGKSTLVDRLAVYWAERGETVAVLAVDPSSALTGGALLGDRIRMDRAASHPAVFVRSLASRGELGGLGSTTSDIVTVLGSLGFDRVLLETVGAGQTDLSIGRVADVVMVMAVPGLGDQLQAAKAGILEIGDLYVVNKSDLPGAASVAGHLEANLDLGYPGAAGRNIARESGTCVAGNHEQRCRHGRLATGASFWRPPVLSVCAHEGSGVAALAAAADDFLAWSRESGRHGARATERVRSRILAAVRERLLQLCLAAASDGHVDLDALAAEVTRGAASPNEVADRLIEQLFTARPST